jgi:hypothetical protein
MDQSTGLELGPSHAGKTSPVSEDLELLLQLVQYLRAWWEEFHESIRRQDLAASVKVHDAMVVAVVIARDLARKLGITLPDYTDMDWSVSVPPPGRVGGAEM